MTLLYFAWVRQRLGLSEELLELPPGVRTLRDLAEHLRARGGAFGEIFSELKALRVAVDREHAGWDSSAQHAKEIAFFPPVTGG